MEHPRRILKAEYMDPIGMTERDLARIIGGASCVASVFSGHCLDRITARLALCLSKVFGTTPEYWLELQTRFDLAQARDHALFMEKLEGIPAIRSAEDIPAPPQKPVPTRFCKNCGESIDDRDPRAVYCDVACNKAYRYRKRKE